MDNKIKILCFNVELKIIIIIILILFILFLLNNYDFFENIKITNKTINNQSKECDSDLSFCKR
jgi:hypothetical protein